MARVSQNEMGRRRENEGEYVARVGKKEMGRREKEGERGGRVGGRGQWSLVVP